MEELFSHAVGGLARGESRAQGVCGVSGGFRERGNGGAMRIAALGVAVAAGLIVAILVPQQILTASRAAAPPRAGVGAPQTAHQRRYHAHDERGSRKRQLRGFAAEGG